jgi:ATP-dependent exoDNAse (exonuclease V) beta subunit
MTNIKKTKETQRESFNIFEAGLENSNLIEASAGTGKTWSITGLYLRMVVEKNLLPENYRSIFQCNSGRNIFI